VDLQVVGYQVYANSLYFGLFHAKNPFGDFYAILARDRAHMKFSVDSQLEEREQDVPDGIKNGAFLSLENGGFSFPR